MLYATCSHQFVMQCNSQSGMPILGNKPIILRESCTSGVHNILTTVMMSSIVVDKSTDNAEPLSIC